jgi:nucleoid-associated protein YgaU
MAETTVMQAAAVGGAGTGAPPQLVRAKLEILTPPADGSAGGDPTVAGTIAFQFNPKELTLTKAAKWDHRRAAGAAKSDVPQFVGAEPAKLTVEMLLDASRTMKDDVVRTVEKLFACCVPTAPSRTAQKPTPPWVRFAWGAITGFTAHITSVNARYTMFSAAGMPVRAVCAVSLVEIGGELGGQNPTSGALEARSLHVLVDGESLAAVAHRHYGDPTQWRAIAEANDIDDPMRLRAGTTLLVPALPGGGRG